MAKNAHAPGANYAVSARYMREHTRQLLRRNRLAIFTIVVLLALLAWTVWTTVQMWTSIEGTMGVHEVIAMWLGIVFSCIVGFGLMGLMFYSSRRGYDEQPKFTVANEDN